MMFSHDVCHACHHRIYVSHHSILREAQAKKIPPSMFLVVLGLGGLSPWGHSLISLLLQQARYMLRTRAVPVLLTLMQQDGGRICAPGQCEAGTPDPGSFMSSLAKYGVIYC